MKNKHCSSLAILIVMVFFAFGSTEKESKTESQPTNPITRVIEFSVRHSLLMSNTGVLQIRNRTGRPINGINVAYYSQDTASVSSYKVGSLDPFAQEEIGVLESGWAIEANEVVSVSADGYDSVALYFWEDDKGRLVWSEGYGAKKLAQFLQALK